MNKMNLTDIKLTILNTILVGATMLNIESIFKIILLIVTIIYTGLRAYELYKNKIKNGPNNIKEDRDTPSED